MDKSLKGLYKIPRQALFPRISTFIATKEVQYKEEEQNSCTLTTGNGSVQEKLFHFILKNERAKNAQRSHFQRHKGLSPPEISSFDLQHFDAAQCLYVHYPPNTITVVPRTVLNTRNTKMNPRQFLPSKSLHPCGGERQ